ncbi:MAG TPA: alanine-zipper protein [Candidatus Competibacteraceae bacterium]|nr:alanine-zipper protein [Candidatus Competibacteraceae bacterium]
MKTIVKFSALALIAGLTVGCASTKDLEAVRQEAQQAQATANQAKSTADEALAVANEAKAMSMATEEKLNRMFGRAMKK